MCDLCLGIDMLCMLCAHLDRRRILSLRLRLDVDIGALGIELVSMPNQTSIGIGLQYQSHCLDADEIARWNRGARQDGAAQVVGGRKDGAARPTKGGRMGAARRAGGSPMSSSPPALDLSPPALDPPPGEPPGER